MANFRKSGRHGRCASGVLVFLLTLCLFTGVAGCELAVAQEPVFPDTVTLYFFHDTACGSCDGTSEFYELAGKALEGVRDLYAFRIVAANVFQTDGSALWARIAAEMGFDADNTTFPALAVNGKLFQGMEAIEKNMREAYLTAGEDLFVYRRLFDLAVSGKGAPLFADIQVNPDVSTLMYFYRITCDECNQTKPLIDALPSAVAVPGGDTPLEVIRLNTRSGNNGDRVRAFFQAYDVPADDQMVPIVFLADRYLAGYEQIAAHLSQALSEGAGLGFRLPSAGETK